MVDSELQKQFSPSLWNKRMPAEIICDKHVEIVTKETLNNKMGIPVKENVKYGDKPTELLDIYGIDLPNDAPIFVYIHGGYWMEFDKDMSGYPAQPLYQSGIKCIVPDYDLAPKVTITDIVDQIRLMGEFVLKIAASDDSRGVWFGGSSAGGHLAACFLNEGWLSELDTNLRDFFKGVVLITGVYHLLPLLKTEVNNVVKMTETEAEENSPQKHIRQFREKRLVPSDFKVIIAVAENDSPAFKRQSEIYYEGLKQNGMDADFMLMPDLDHYNIMEELMDSTSVLTKKIMFEITKQIV